MNGIYAFKPTVSLLPYHLVSEDAYARASLTDCSQSSRFPVTGVAGPTEGQEHVHFSSGPMARDMESLTYFSRLVARSRPWDFDSKCVPLPWDDTVLQDIQSRPLVIGLIRDDGVVKVHPPIARVLEEAVSKLEQQGHEIVLWDTSDHHDCVKIMDQYYAVDGFEDVRRDIAVAGEPMIPHVQSLADRAEGKALSVYEYWQVNKKKHEIRLKFLQRWNAVRSPSGKPLDVLLGPTTAHTAIPHHKWRWGGYTKVWNLLDYPAISFPTDQVRKEVDVQPSDYEPRNDLDAWNWSLYDADMMDGHKVSLQVIGKTLNDEKVLAAATVIEDIWRS